MTQSTYRSANINYKPPQLVDAAFYADIRFDPTENNPDYIGLHKLNGAETSDTDWKIYKFTYTGTDVTRIRLSYGAWDDRVSLFP